MAVYNLFKCETKNSVLYQFELFRDKNTKVTQITCVHSVPDELIIVEEGCVFDQTETLFHSVHK